MRPMFVHTLVCHQTVVVYLHHTSIHIWYNVVMQEIVICINVLKMGLLSKLPKHVTLNGSTSFFLEVSK